MTKNVQIRIIIDDVELSDIEKLEDRIREALEDWETKRITMTIQDEPMLTRPTRR